MYQEGDGTDETTMSPRPGGGRVRILTNRRPSVRRHGFDHPSPDLPWSGVLLGVSGRTSDIGSRPGTFRV